MKKMRKTTKTTPTFKTMDKLLAVADSENTLSCECDNVSRLKSLKSSRKKLNDKMKKTIKQQYHIQHWQSHRLLYDCACDVKKAHRLSSKTP